MSNIYVNTAVACLFVVGLLLSKFGGIDGFVKKIFHKDEEDQEQ